VENLGEQPLVDGFGRCGALFDLCSEVGEGFFGVVMGEDVAVVGSRYS
jgi:hypothetical protein